VTRCQQQGGAIIRRLAAGHQLRQRLHAARQNRSQDEGGPAAALRIAICSPSHGKRASQFSDRYVVEEQRVLRKARRPSVRALRSRAEPSVPRRSQTTHALKATA